MKKNKSIISIIIALLVGGGGYAVADNVNFGTGFFDTGNITLVGSSVNLVSIPLTPSYTNSTTTNDVAHEDPGATVQQLVSSSGIREIILNIQAIGGTATSTLHIRQMGSTDDSNYFDIATSTLGLTGTTTFSIVENWVDVTPGTATSSISIPFTIDGYQQTRFVIWGDNLETDPDDGVQAWIETIIVEDIER